MLALAGKAAELAVARIESLPDESAWDGEFKEGLENVNREVLARLFWDDRAFVSSTSLHGTFALRLCIINHSTGWDDVRETLEAMERFGEDALAG